VVVTFGGAGAVTRPAFIKTAVVSERGKTFVSMVALVVCRALKWVDGVSDLVTMLSMAGLAPSTRLYLLGGER
jgi:hypothetical protein